MQKSNVEGWTIGMAGRNRQVCCSVRCLSGCETALKTVSVTDKLPLPGDDFFVTNTMQANETVRFGGPIV